ncbi:MAG: chorismate synthase [Candidatus Kariarchaeaceae archaeon]|jgi:chorismate synthase
MNSIGSRFRLNLIGSSHGNLVGVVIDGIPPAMKINEEEIAKELNKRRPGQSQVTTDRDEKDKLIIETGIMNGYTNAEPLVAYVRNTDIDSSYYDEIRDTPRPGHADYPARVKYGGANDYRGGGRFSGRLTLGLVIAGSIAQQILSQSNIKLTSYAIEIGGIQGNESQFKLSEANIYASDNPVRVADPNIIPQVISRIEEVKSAGDSVGGVIECVINGLPVGLGEPWFNKFESVMAQMIFSVPAVKGIEFGSGFTASRMMGSEHNDAYYHTLEGKVGTRTNNAGGVLGGLTNGMQVKFRVAFKPTSSIQLEQETVNLRTQESGTLRIQGRHDPCIIPRAVPVVTNAAACVVMDLMLMGGFITNSMQEES